MIAQVMPNAKPIIFWDTCMLLYILSLAVRDTFTEFDKYKQLLARIENGDVISVTSSVVWDEFTQHYADIKTGAEADQSNLKRVLKGYADCIGEPSKSSIVNAADSMNLTLILEDMEKRVWQNTYIINENAQLRNAAHFRVLHKMSPSENKDQYKDALIWSTFLQMAKRLPRAQVKVFVTANKEDYCISKRSTQLQQTIKDDCKNVQAELSLNVEALFNLITRELRKL